MFCSKVEDMPQATQSSFRWFNRIDLFSEFIFEEGVHCYHCGIVVRGIVELEISNLLTDTIFFDYIKETSRDIRSTVFTNNLRKADESIAYLARGIAPMGNHTEVRTISRWTGPKIQRQMNSRLGFLEDANEFFLLIAKLIDNAAPDHIA